MSVQEIQKMAPQKRSADEADSLLFQIQAVVFDIEGTTTPISFVKDELFPYVRNNVEKYLTEKFEDAETIKDVAALRDLAVKDKADGVEGVVDIPESSEGKEEVIKAVVANVRWQMDNDRKSTELKQLQGHMWRQAYESGTVKGLVFEDVPKVLKDLSKKYKLYVYSSGSVEAQKLLFGNTEKGDISSFFTDFFDTAMGAKVDSESYKKIAAEIGVQGQHILFLTDIPAEAGAAEKAEWRSALVIRPGNADLKDEHLRNFTCIKQLDEIYDDQDEENVKRLNTGGNGEAEDDEEDEVDEDEEGEEEGEEDEGDGEGEDA